MHDKKTMVSGTARSNRCPKEIQSKKLAKGESVCLTDGKVFAVKWEDKKAVHLLSTGGHLFHECNNVII